MKQLFKKNSMMHRFVAGCLAVVLAIITAFCYGDYRLNAATVNANIEITLNGISDPSTVEAYYCQLMTGTEGNYEFIGDKINMTYNYGGTFTATCTYDDAQTPTAIYIEGVEQDAGVTIGKWIGYGAVSITGIDIAGTINVGNSYKLDVTQTGFPTDVYATYKLSFLKEKQALREAVWVPSASEVIVQADLGEKYVITEANNLGTTSNGIWSYTIASSTQDVSINLAADYQYKLVANTTLPALYYKEISQPDTAYMNYSEGTMLSASKGYIFKYSVTGKNYIRSIGNGTVDTTGQNWTYEIPPNTINAANDAEKTLIDLTVEEQYALTFDPELAVTYKKASETDYQPYTGQGLSKSETYSFRYTAPTGTVIVSANKGSITDNVWNYDIPANTGVDETITITLGQALIQYKNSTSMTEIPVYGGWTYDFSVQSDIYQAKDLDWTIVPGNTDTHAANFVLSDTSDTVKTISVLDKQSIPTGKTIFVTVQIKKDGILLDEQKLVLQESALVKGRDYELYQGKDQTTLSSDGTYLAVDDDDTTVLYYGPNLPVWLEIKGGNYDSYRTATSLTLLPNTSWKKVSQLSANDNPQKLPSAKYYLQMRNEASQITSKRQEMAFQYDNVAPTISVNEQRDTAGIEEWTKASQIQATVGESGSGIANVYISNTAYTTLEELQQGTDKVEMTPVTGKAYNYIFDINENHDATGKDYYIYAIDHVDNMSVSSVLNVKKVDINRPVVAITPRASEQGVIYLNRKEAVIATVEITEDAQGDESLFDQASFQSSFASANPKLQLTYTGSIEYNGKIVEQYQITLGNILADENEFTMTSIGITLKDKAGNQAANISGFNLSKIVLDDAKPVVTVSVAAESEQFKKDTGTNVYYANLIKAGVKTDVTVETVTIVDSNFNETAFLAGFNSTVFKVTRQSYDSATKTYVYDIILKQDTVDGAYMVPKVDIQDYAGNVADESIALGPIRVDSSVPQIQIQLGAQLVAQGTNYLVKSKDISIETITVTDGNFDAETFENSFATENTDFRLERRVLGDQYIYDVYFKDSAADGKYGISAEHIVVQDALGNKVEDTQIANIAVSSIILDTVAPILTCSVASGDDTDGKYTTSATATFTLKEANPKEDAMVEQVMVETTDVKGNSIAKFEAKVGGTKIDSLAMLQSVMRDHGNWSYDSTKGVYTLQVEFIEEARYAISASTTDLAGNTCVKPVKDIHFVVDRTAPTLKFTLSEEAKKEFSDYGYISNKEIPVLVTVTDDISGIDMQSITMMLQDMDGKLYQYKASAAQVQATPEAKTSLYSSAEFTFIIGKDVSFKGQLMEIGIQDIIGNKSTSIGNGIIVEQDDDHDKNAELSLEISKAYQGNYYGNDVTMTAKAKDTFSGIRKVECIIERQGQTETKLLYQAPTTGSIVAEMPNSGQVLQLPASQYEGNDIKAYLKLTDNAGNVRTTREKAQVFHIDLTKPVIKVDFDLHRGNGYYNVVRTANIQITEKNLDYKKVYVRISQEGKTGYQEIIPEISTVGDVHSIKVPFAEDGNQYTFTVEAYDLAGNVEHYDMKDAFTVDRTSPRMTIEYDNYQVSHDRYYGSGRTATVVIAEKNFDASLVNMQITGANQGTQMEAPQISGFTKRGDEDVYTATVSFNQDGEFTITGTVNDLAGNTSAQLSVDEFVIDLIAPEVTLQGIIENHSYNGEIAPGIAVTDVNFDQQGVGIRVVGGKNGQQNNVSYNKEETEQSGTYTFNDFAHKANMDDVYTLEVSATDLAGHNTTKTVAFKVNRFGSVYQLDEYTQSVVDAFYTNAEQDFVILETNVDKVTKAEIYYSKDGEIYTLEEQEDYEINQEVNDHGWNNYTYTIKKSALDSEGIYTFSIYSEDVAGNKMDNKSKGQDIEVCIDRTAPSQVITGVEPGGVYEAEALDIVIDVYDNIYLKEILVELNGEETIYEPKDLQDGKLTITVNEAAKEQSIRVKSIDGAGNITDSKDQGDITFTVSTNRVATTIAKASSNSLWLYILGGLLIALIVTGIIVFGKKKNDEE